MDKFSIKIEQHTNNMSMGVRVIGEDGHTYLVDMKDGTLLDAYHFDGVSSEFLGNKMFEIIKDF